jgi:hypothetical protein
MEVESIDDLVFKVGDWLCGGHRARHSKYFAHGSGADFSIGEDAATTINLSGNLSGIARLSPHFDGDGAICLQVRDAGQSPWIMLAMARLTGVPAPTPVRTA